MKKTYIKPMNIIESADLMDDVMQTGSVQNTGIEGFDKGDDTGTGGITDADARDVVSRNIWDDEW